MNINCIQYKDVLNIFAIILGWFVVHYFSVKREKDKEKRVESHNLILALEELERKAKEYHTSIMRDIFLEQKLIYEVEKIRRRLCRLKLNNTQEQTRAFRNMRKAITGSNFSSSDFHQQLEDSAIIRDITYSINSVIKTVDNYIIRNN